MQLILKSNIDSYGAADLLRLFFGTCQQKTKDGQTTLTTEPYPELCWQIDAANQDGFIIDMATGNVIIESDAGTKQVAKILPEALVPTFIKPKRDHKRALYFALSKLTGINFPWGSLTGIRPTLVAAETLKLCDNKLSLAHSLLINYYGLDKFKASIVLATAKEEQAIISSLDSASIGVYIGIPFCPSRCVYCSFSTDEGIGKGWNLIDPYMEALISEIRLTAPYIDQPISTLYVGGGTPGILNAAQINKLSEAIHQYLPLKPDCEMTFEAGRPDKINRDMLEAVKAGGFQKICVNPQTFHDATLTRINRTHTVQQVLEAQSIAKELGFASINMDLILGLPGESISDMEFSLEQLERLAPNSFTVHVMAVKRASKLKLIATKNKENYLDLHRRNHELENLQRQALGIAKRLGLVPYYMYRQKDGLGGLENLGYASKGLGNKYNLAMMGDGISVISFGAGAMSKRVIGDRVERSPNVRSIEQYIARVDEMVARKIALFVDKVD